jgi:hypothetical protein
MAKNFKKFIDDLKDDPRFPFVGDRIWNPDNGIIRINLKEVYYTRRNDVNVAIIVRYDISSDDPELQGVTEECPFCNQMHQHGEDDHYVVKCYLNELEDLMEFGGWGEESFGREYPIYVRAVDGTLLSSLDGYMVVSKAEYKKIVRMQKLQNLHKNEEH